MLQSSMHVHHCSSTCAHRCSSTCALTVGAASHITPPPSSKGTLHRLLAVGRAQPAAATRDRETPQVVRKIFPGVIIRTTIGGSEPSPFLRQTPRDSAGGSGLQRDVLQ